MSNTPSSEPPSNEVATTSKTVENVVITNSTPSTPLIKRYRPMTDEMILRAPSKERTARRSETFASSICYPQTPRRRSDFQYLSKPLFAEGIKE
uniref:Uncharacterized protein n=1 Tax=Panagrolaimus davidi TaxID=227884 RepID=A0A914R0T4_9BILA